MRNHQGSGPPGRERLPRVAGVEVMFTTVDRSWIRSGATLHPLPQVGHPPAGMPKPPLGARPGWPVPPQWNEVRVSGPPLRSPHHHQDVGLPGPVRLPHRSPGSSQLPPAPRPHHGLMPAPGNDGAPLSPPSSPRKEEQDDGHVPEGELPDTADPPTHQRDVSSGRVERGRGLWEPPPGLVRRSALREGGSHSRIHVTPGPIGATPGPGWCRSPGPPPLRTAETVHLVDPPSAGVKGASYFPAPTSAPIQGSHRLHPRGRRPIRASIHWLRSPPRGGESRTVEADQGTSPASTPSTGVLTITGSGAPSHYPTGGNCRPEVWMGAVLQGDVLRASATFHRSWTQWPGSSPAR